MDELHLRRKLAHICKGQKVVVFPQSMKYGDESTAIGVPCSTYESNPVELFDPFEAFLEDFDGEVLKLRTNSLYCLKVALIDLADISDLSPKSRRQLGM